MCKQAGYSVATTLFEEVVSGVTDQIYTKSSGNLKQSVNFLGYPLWSPTRHPGKRYRYTDGQGSYLARCRNRVKVKNMGNFLDGEIKVDAMPTGRDAKVLYAMLQKARWTGRGWTATYASGRELYDVLGIKTKFNNLEADRVCEALFKWMAVHVTFDGLFYNRRKGKRQVGSQAFSIVTYAHVIKDGHNWEIEVGFNDHFMTEILQGFSTGLHLETFYSLPSDFARRLFEWLTARLAQQRETRIGVGKLMDTLGMAGSGSIRNRQEGIDKVLAAVDLINEVYPSAGRRYGCDVDENGYLVFTKHLRRRH